MKKLVLAVLLGAASLSACETISPEERERRAQLRVQAYEESVRARFVGRPADELVLTLGPPSSTFTLSDGREVLQYDDRRSETTGGETWTSWQSVTRERVVVDANGVRRVVRERDSIPVAQTSPVRTYQFQCTRRFVIARDKTVESFRWGGNACF